VMSLHGGGFVVFLILCATTATASSRLPLFDAWDRVVSLHVSNGTKDGITTHVVDYAKIKNDSNFVDFVASLNTVNTTALTSVQLYSVFMNAYNALAIKMIDNPCKKSIFGRCLGPISSITDIGFKVHGAVSSVWLKPAGSIGGKVYSLQQIEDFLRAPTPFHEDPRLHSCIVCASISCPNVRTEAFLPETLDAQMNSQMQDMLSNPKKGLSLDRATNTLTLSKIFDWYKSDFEALAGSVVNFIAPFLTSESDRLYILQHSAALHIAYFEYDWGANGVVPCTC